MPEQTKRSAGGGSNITVDHGLIQKWVEERGGVPVSVKGTSTAGETGLLRIQFPGYGKEEPFNKISWDEFFTKFDEKNLAFLYQDETRDGKQSRFFKFIARKS
ncbi:MAG: hypothetical protein KGJ07_06665 [Patescibacteria group bacterium]|nr:hypothetical protein [Patescibacteria group bacterium]MDE2590694.1 hypothetical protein [Patescibacteria group bacterium]